jgi:hypothetical protein
VIIIIYPIFFSINYWKTIDNIGKIIYYNIEIRQDLKKGRTDNEHEGTVGDSPPD